MRVSAGWPQAILDAEAACAADIKSILDQILTTRVHIIKSGLTQAANSLTMAK